jgi:methyl-accepting chemotaxis protein
VRPPKAALSARGQIAIIAFLVMIAASGGPLVSAFMHWDQLATQQEELLIGAAIGIGAGLGALFALVSLARNVLRPVEDARSAAQAMQKDNLDQPVLARGAAELRQLGEAMEGLRLRLKEVMDQVRNSVEQIETAASEVALGNTDLSARTESAAANLQETSSSVANMTSTVSANAQSARQANQLARSSSEVAKRGGEVMGEVEQTMRSITQSSSEIVEIIAVIDSIAFQTNILALNAAVEAARAGEQGRGFAVVAGEVRSLAQRSAEAAAQIKTLISSSVNSVEAGSKQVNAAAQTMREIVHSVSRVSDIIGEISAATEEQSTQINQINSAISQLDGMTQQNAALVEQSAAAAQSMKDQAAALTMTVGRFKGARASSAGATGSNPAVTAPSARPAPTKPLATRPDTAPAQSPSNSTASKAALRTPALRPPEKATPIVAPATSLIERAAARPEPRPLVQTGTAASAKPTASLPAATGHLNDDDWETF